MSNATTLSAPPEKRYFSTEGALEFLETFASLKLSKSRFFALTSAGKIPCRKTPTGRLLIPIDELTKWVEGTDENLEA